MGNNPELELADGNMIILSLDLATNTGWASYADGQITIGSASFALKRGDSPGMRFLRCRSWLREMLKLLENIDLICYEQPHQRGGHPTQVAMGLVTEVLSFSARANIETTSVHSMSLKKWATGKGNAKKPQMIQEAKSRGYDVANDDEADAVLMLEYTLEDLNVQTKSKTKLVKRR
jgi:Holliday junction resolvasome RuvABC endonuclease subunit